MTHVITPNATQDALSAQELALHLIVGAERILLMIGTAVLVDEIAADPARRLITARRQHHPDAMSDASGPGPT